MHECAHVGATCKLSLQLECLLRSLREECLDELLDSCVGEPYNLEPPLEEAVFGQPERSFAHVPAVRTSALAVQKLQDD